MLLLLAEYLQQFHKGFAVFQYLTLRGILGVLTALVLSLHGNALTLSRALWDAGVRDGPPDRPVTVEKVQDVEQVGDQLDRLPAGRRDHL